MGRKEIPRKERMAKKMKGKAERKAKKKIEEVERLHLKLATEKPEAPRVDVTNCLRCNKSIPTDRIRKYAKYCSNNCCHEAAKEKYRIANPRRLGNMATATMGAISEFRVVVDCLSMGYEVFKACSPACSCDLAILYKNQLKRIEVKTAFRTPAGNISHSNHNIRADILARVLPDKIIYDPPLPKIK